MRTVFILGAGASIPYGFPSGYQLVQAIQKDLIEKRENFKSWGCETYIDAFRKAIEYRRPIAIDDLINERREFLEIGRLAIAQALVQYEQEGTLFSRQNAENWYGYVFERINELREPITPGSFTFITFNYDRSLEHYLHMASEHGFGQPGHFKKQSIQDIPVIHVHGQLGVLPYRNGNAPYAPSEDRGHIHGVSQFLRLIHDESGEQTIAAAEVAIQKATSVLFLGFGYHENNLAKLDFDQIVPPPIPVGGTTKGFTEAERATLIQRHPRLRDVDRAGNTVLDYFRAIPPYWCR